MVPFRSVTTTEFRRPLWNSGEFAILDYCLVLRGEDWQTLPIQIGANNNTHVVIHGGLAEGDRVALTPFRFMKRSDLPDAASIDVARDGKLSPSQGNPSISGAVAKTQPAS